MSLLKKIWPNPLHCFLIPSFFIIHNYINFYGLFQLSTIKSLLFIWLLLPAILYFLFYFLLGNKSNAGIYSTLLLFIFFFSVPIQQFLKSLPVLNTVLKLPIFLAIVLIIIVFVFYLLKKNKLKFGLKTHMFFSTSLLILLLYDIGGALRKGEAKLIKKSLFIKTGLPDLRKDSSLSQQLHPDIYYFLFDMHGSTSGIQKSLGYNNSKLDSNLTSMNYTITTNSTSATNYTLTSMAAVFNMAPLPLENNNFLTFYDAYKARLTLQQNILIPFLQKNNYRIVNASTFPLYNDDTTFLYRSGWGHPEELILNQTLATHLITTYKWLLTDLFPSYFKSMDKIIYSDDLRTTKESLEIVNSEIISKDSSKPKFVYTHLFIPHEPFKYDSTGAVIPWAHNLYEGSLSNKLFINQLVYCRNLISELARKIQINSSRNTIIIFQGDHGIRGGLSNDKNVFKVLNAISATHDTKFKIVNEFYTPNTFRLLLNTYFGKNLPMLETKHNFITIK